MAKKKAKVYRWSRIRHEQIYLRTRGHRIDLHAYPILQRLWDAGIQTFYSCQGGPEKLRYQNREVIKSDRAMVIVLKKDQEKTLKILRNLNPEVKPWGNRTYRDRVAIYFDPSEEAQAVIVVVTTK
jgi:5,10-methylenetetrahydrofolate reductase